MIILRQKLESLIGPSSLFYRPKYNPNQKLSPEKEEQINRELLELIGDDEDLIEDDEELRKLYKEMKKGKKK